MCADTFFCKNEILLCISNISKARNLCVYVCMYVLHVSQELFIWSTSYLAGGLLGKQGSAILMCEVVGWAVLEEYIKNTS